MDDERITQDEIDFRAALENALSDGETEATGETDIGQAEQPSIEAQTDDNTGITETTGTPVAEQQNPQGDNMLAYLIEQNRQLQAQIAEQNAAMRQQSELARGAVEGSMEQPAVGQGMAEGTGAEASPLPMLDLDELRYMSGEDQARTIAEWQNATQEALLARSEAAMMQKLSPMMEDYRRGQEANAMAAAKAKITGDARFADFAGMDEQINSVMANTPTFEALDPEQRYLLSGLIARGMNSQPPAPMSTDEIVELVLKNPDAMKAIETRRAMEIDDGNRAVPKLAGSSGMSSASAIPEGEPQSYEDIARLMRNRLG